MNQAVDMLKTNDTDLLKLDQVEPFRQYLLSHKCQTRKGNGSAQLLFVRTTAGWAVVQKGAGGTVKTPIGLRPVIEDFLKSPLTRSLDLHKRMCQGSKLDLEGALARRVAAAVLESAPAPAADGEWRKLNGAMVWVPGRAPLPKEALECVEPVAELEDGGRCGTNTGSGDQPVDPAAERARQWAEFGKLAERVGEELKNCPGPHILLSPELRERALKGGLMIIPAPAADLQHLEDLRDDFAIHCPLPMREGEDLATYADRRWAYADLMMAKRSPRYADK